MLRGDDERAFLSLFMMVRLFAFAYGNGVLLSSYFIVTLPIESKRISPENSAMYLGGFVAIAGITQLICPIVGLMSDRCAPSARKPFAMCWVAHCNTAWTVDTHQTNC